MSLRKNIKKGFSLIELIVTVAIMGIVGSFVVASYSDRMREQRHEADTAMLTDVNHQLELLFTYDDVWQEVQQYLVGENIEQKDTLVLRFHCTSTDKAGQFIIRDTQVNDRGESFDVLMPVLCGHLQSTFGQSIEMISSDHSSGEYIVTCVFQGKKISSVREWKVSNDYYTVTGVENWHQAGWN